jgi:hypothetical protein
VAAGPHWDDMVCCMKTISVAVSESDYDAFREAARRRDRSIAQLIRDAMARYRETELEPRTPLRSVPVLPGHSPVGKLPSRSELYDEIFEPRAGATAEGDPGAP